MFNGWYMGMYNSGFPEPNITYENLYSTAWAPASAPAPVLAPAPASAPTLEPMTEFRWKNLLAVDEYFVSLMNQANPFLSLSMPEVMPVHMPEVMPVLMPEVIHEDDHIRHKNIKLLQLLRESPEEEEVGNKAIKGPANGSKRLCMTGKGDPENASFKYRENASFKYRGVRQRANGRWIAEIRRPKRGKRIWLGTHDTSVQAAIAYNNAAKDLYGDRARLNFTGYDQAASSSSV